MAAAIAAAFGVRADYFSGTEGTDGQPAAPVPSRSAGVEMVALRAEGLSENGLATLLAAIEKIRADEGLPAAPPGSPEPGR